MDDNNNFENFSEKIEDNFYNFFQNIKTDHNIAYSINNTSSNSNNDRIPINNQIEEYILDVILLDEPKKKEKKENEIKNNKKQKKSSQK